MTDNSPKKRLKKQFLLLDSSLGSHWNSAPKPRRVSASKPPDSLGRSASPPKRQRSQDGAVSGSSTARASPGTGKPDSRGAARPSPSEPRSVSKSRSSSQAQQEPVSKPLGESSTGTSNMSQRNRGQRGANRNSEVGEEYGLWRTVDSSINSLVSVINESSENIESILEQDKRMVERREAGDHDKRDATGKSLRRAYYPVNVLSFIGARTELKADLSNIDALLRTGVKINDKTAAEIKQTIESLKVLSAIQKAKEEAQEPSFSRSATQRAKESTASTSVYDFDGSGDSPVPSPNPSVARRMGGSSASKGDRGSMPPSTDRSTPVAKAGSAEPQGSAANIARSKVIFSKGEEVAFKPKPQSSEPTDWILGVVQDVRGEGKSRRYRVLDADVDENGKQKEFRSSASSMIGIPKEGTVLQPLDPGKTVLALYPATTTFYKAEVHGMDVDGKVNLKFEGEESSNTMQAVARRYVVEYRA